MTMVELQNSLAVSLAMVIKGWTLRCFLWVLSLTCVYAWRFGLTAVRPQICRGGLHLHEISSLKSIESTVNGDIKPTLDFHPSLLKGKLANGLQYFVLPNKNPQGRFEAHLEVLSGSAMELENQQGMAHLMEHVAYMGSTKRHLISGTGSKTNAYTDFHHTVFFASCPVAHPGNFWRKSMLPLALDALVEVMNTRVTSDRLEKERAAVLSEASMVNKMEYRVECQILQELHRENIISCRLPIGKIEQISRWTIDDVQYFHDLHYRPDNAVLYVVGDLDPQEAANTIASKFGSLRPKMDSDEVLKKSGLFPQTSMRQRSRHYPMVAHNFVPSFADAAIDDIAPPQPPKEVLSALLRPNTRVFEHGLLQATSFHLFAKRPPYALTTEAHLREQLLQRMVTSALQVRLNILQREEPLFSFADFNQMRWTREGCQICSLDLSSDPQRWREGVAVAIAEVQRLGRYGLTPGEIERFKAALLQESQQRMAQDPTHEELIQNMMDGMPHGDVFSSREALHDATLRVLSSLQTEEVTRVARDLCSHLSRISETCKPCAVVLCSPHAVSEDEVVEAVVDGLQRSLPPIADLEVPTNLLPDEVLAAKAAEYSATVVSSTDPAPLSSEMASQYRVLHLSNGLRVSLCSHSGEAEKAALRLRARGGRMVERQAGSMALGGKVVQEGGAFRNTSREQVELFCVDHHVAVEVAVKPDAVLVDMDTTTASGPGGLSGVEAALQVAHILLTDARYEDNAFHRALVAAEEAHSAANRALDSACQQALLHSMTGGDARHLEPSPEALRRIPLPLVEAEMREAFRPENVEIILAGDLPLDKLEALAVKYLRVVPPFKMPNSPASSLAQEASSMRVTPLGSAKQLAIHLHDNDERAVGYLAGEAPNRLGLFSDGSQLAERMARQLGRSAPSHWLAPHFPMVLLEMVQEVANRRLFSIVREERQLTYDATLQFHGQDGLQGSYYTVFVTSSPVTVQRAVAACVEALGSLYGPFGVSGDMVSSAKHTVLERISLQSQTNKFYLDALAGCQDDHLAGRKGFWREEDFRKVVESITVADVQAALAVLSLKPENMTVCVGTAGPDASSLLPR